MGTPSEEDLGTYLRSLRAANNMTLRAVEEATGKAVKNAYLSQLENGQIGKPSPEMLWHLARVYGVEYSDLLVRSGVRVPATGAPSRQARKDMAVGIPLQAIRSLDDEDRKDLLEYIAFLQQRKQRRDLSERRA